MSEIVIKAENISKQYQLGKNRIWNIEHDIAIMVG